MRPQAGDLLLITDRASVQFAAVPPFLFRVIRPHDWSTYQGWVWLDGYQLNAAGAAEARRSIFVQFDGLIYARQAPASTRPRHRRAQSRAMNTRPAVSPPRRRTYIDVEPDRP